MHKMALQQAKNLVPEGLGFARPFKTERLKGSDGLWVLELGAGGQNRKLQGLRAVFLSG